jgi:hypothetical protein
VHPPGDLRSLRCLFDTAGDGESREKDRLWSFVRANRVGPKVCHPTQVVAALRERSPWITRQAEAAAIVCAVAFGRLDSVELPAPPAQGGASLKTPELAPNLARPATSESVPLPGARRRRKPGPACAT